MKKLDMRGVAHDVMMVAFVAIFAIAGVAYLVASHADTCPIGQPVSAASGCKQQVVCYITGVPTVGVRGQIVKPKLAINNVSAKTVKFNMYTYTSAYAVPSKGGILATSHFSQQLQAGHLSVHVLKAYKVAYATTNVKYIQYGGSFVNHGAPACTATMQLPAKPASAPATQVILND